MISNFVRKICKPTTMSSLNATFVNTICCNHQSRWMATNSRNHAFKYIASIYNNKHDEKRLTKLSSDAKKVWNGYTRLLDSEIINAKNTQMKIINYKPKRLLNSESKCIVVNARIYFARLLLLEANLESAVIFSNQTMKYCENYDCKCSTKQTAVRQHIGILRKSNKSDDEINVYIKLL